MLVSFVMKKKAREFTIWGMRERERERRERERHSNSKALNPYFKTKLFGCLKK